MSLIKKMSGKKVIKNPNKPGYTIEIDTTLPQGAYRGNETYQASSEEVSQITSLVSTRLLNLIKQLEFLLISCPDLANSDLEILETSTKIQEVKAYVNQNKIAFTKKLDAAVKQWSSISDFKPRDLFMFGDFDSFISKVIDYLYSNYKKEVSSNGFSMNNIIKMLLELDVRGIQKAKTAKID